MIKKCIWTECNSIHELSTKSNDINLELNIVGISKQ